MKQFKHFIWNILDWIDNNINHTIIDELTNHIPLEDKDGNDSLFYIVWEHTANKYCNWVSELWFKWFEDEAVKKS